MNDDKKSKARLIDEITELRNKISKQEFSALKSQYDDERISNHTKRMRKLAELSMMLAGEPVIIFEKIASMIGELLDVKIVCLSEIQDDKLFFLSVYNQGEVFQNAGVCSLVTTPCATVKETKDFRTYDNVADKFPEAKFLKEHNAYSYCGFPAMDSKGNVVSVMCLLTDKPHVFTQEDKDLLQIFSQRISFEIERKNYLSEKKQLKDKLIQSQKLESIGTLAGGIAHDFNNILTAILGYAELGQLQSIDNKSICGYFQEVLTAGNRAKDLVKHILTFSRQTEQEKGPIQPNLIIKEVLMLIKASTPSNIEVKENIKNDCGCIWVDPTQIHQVLMNLCTNAVHSMDENGGVLDIKLNRIDLTKKDGSVLNLEPGEYMNLEIHDTGCGIDANIIDRIFDPYFTTKKIGEGTGLGLAVVHGIVKDHDGSISVKSELGKGTSFHVLLPTTEINTSSGQLRVELPPVGTERILLIDDEASLVSVEKHLLESLGYTITARTSSVEALEAFKAHPQKFDLVITDQTMPNMTGVELAQELLLIRPDIPIILCTGFSKQVNEVKAKSLGIKAFAMKPLALIEIANIIRRVLGTS